MGLMGGVKGRMMKEVTWHVVHVTVVECRDWNQSVLMFFVKKKRGGGGDTLSASMRRRPRRRICSNTPQWHRHPSPSWTLGSARGDRPTGVAAVGAAYVTGATACYPDCLCSVWSPGPDSSSRRTGIRTAKASSVAGVAARAAGSRFPGRRREMGSPAGACTWCALSPR
jgi:hypothetical protein